MIERTRIVVALLALLLAGGCSSETSPIPDSGGGTGGGADGAPAADTSPAADQGADAKGPFKTAKMHGNVSLATVQQCSTTSKSRDCKGPLLVALFDKAQPTLNDPAVASFAVGDVDLTGGKTAAYTLKDIPLGKTLYLFARLRDGNVVNDKLTTDEDRYTGPRELTPALAADEDRKLDIELEVKPGPI